MNGRIAVVGIMEMAKVFLIIRGISIMHNKVIMYSICMIFVFFGCVSTTSERKNLGYNSYRNMRNGDASVHVDYAIRYNLNIKVFDANTSLCISDAVISLTFADNILGKTNDNGEFSCDLDSMHSGTKTNQQNGFQDNIIISAIGYREIVLNLNDYEIVEGIRKVSVYMVFQG